MVSAFFRAKEKNDAEITVFNFILLFSVEYFWSVVIQLICFTLLAFLVYKTIFSQYFPIATYLPFSVIMLLGTVCQNAHIFGNQTIATFFLILSILQFIKTDSKKDNSVTILNTFLLLIMSVFFVPEFIYFIPVLFLGFVFFIDFKIKTLGVITFSILTPVLCALGLCYLSGNVEVFYSFFSNFFDLKFKINTNFFDISTVFMSIVSVVFVLISLFFYLQNIYKYKLYVRYFTHFLIFLWCVTILLIIFLNNIAYFSLIYIILASFFIVLNFSNLQSKCNSIFFLIFLVLCFGTYAVQFFLY
jgi:hypothetical protein